MSFSIHIFPENADVIPKRIRGPPYMPYLTVFLVEELDFEQKFHTRKSQALESVQE